jgi:hypothetical protein
MEKQRLTYLLEQYMADTATAAERQELSDTFKKDADQELFKTVLAEMMLQETPMYPADPNPWQLMVHDIVHIDKASPEPVKKASPRVIRLYRWVVAAAVLLAIGWGIYFFNNRARQTAVAIIEKKGPELSIMPVNKNVLLLSDGSQLLLDEVTDGKIAKQKNTTISKLGKRIIYTATDQKTEPYYNVISTARSGIYEVVLPDGSSVWLNSASSIRFPAIFTGHERLVELSGEAWFEVKHADKIPFLVRSRGITTAVMGTAFDIKSYPGQEAIIVSVQRGRVKIQTGDTVLATLEKGRQVRIKEDATFTQKDIDTSYIATWKQGDLFYKDETLQDIVSDLQRVFKTSIEIKRASLSNEIITASFNRNIGLQNGLEIICRIADGRLSYKNGIFFIQ